jgi:hypothetical protein
MNEADKESKVDLALKAVISPDALTEAEQEEFFDRFADQLKKPDAKVDAFWAERRRLGLGVGMDEAGNLVYQTPEDPGEAPGQDAASLARGIMVSEAERQRETLRTNARRVDAIMALEGFDVSMKTAESLAIENDVIEGRLTYDEAVQRYLDLDAARHPLPGGVREDSGD